MLQDLCNLACRERVQCGCCIFHLNIATERKEIVAAWPPSKAQLPDDLVSEAVIWSPCRALPALGRSRV